MTTQRAVRPADAVRLPLPAHYELVQQNAALIFQHKHLATKLATIHRVIRRRLGIPAGLDLTDPLGVIGHSSKVQHAIDCPKASWFTRRVKRSQTDRLPFSKSIGIVGRLESAPVVRVQRKACVYMQITEKRRTLFRETDAAFAPSLSAAGRRATRRLPFLVFPRKSLRLSLQFLGELSSI